MDKFTWDKGDVEFLSPPPGSKPIISREEAAEFKAALQKYREEMAADERRQQQEAGEGVKE